MKITRLLFAIILVFILSNNGSACCAGPTYTLTELLTQTETDIFEVEVDSIGYDHDGGYLSKGNITRLHRGNPKSEIVYIHSGGNSSAGGRRLEIGVSYLIFSGSRDGINYGAFVCDYYSSDMNSRTSKYHHTPDIVRQYFDALQSNESGIVRLESNNNLLAEGKMRNGVLDGTWSHYQPGSKDGKVVLKSSRTYKNGIVHGKSVNINISINFSEESSTSRKMESISNYHNGKLLNSESFSQYENKEKILTQRTTYTYTEGLQYKYHTAYNDNGNLATIRSYMNIEFYKWNRENSQILRNVMHGEYKSYTNGILVEEGYYENGAKVGKWIKYDDSGLLTSEELLDYPEIDKDSLFIFHPEGNIALKGQVKNGMMQGIWKTYSTQGDLQFTGEYEKGLLNGTVMKVDTKGNVTEATFTNGKKNGLSITTRDSKVIAKKYFIDDLKEGAFTYFRNDSLSKIENYRNNKLHGLVATFNSNGDTLIHKTYTNGMLVGKYVHYHLGNISEEGRYENGQRVGIWKIYQYHLNYYMVVDYLKGDPSMNPSFTRHINSKKIDKYVDLNGVEINEEEVKRREQEYRDKKKLKKG